VVGGTFRLGDWLVEPRLNRLTRDDESIQIELKMMDVLVCLAEHAGELVERQHLIDTVWATEFISENILTRAIAELRNVLGDDAKNPSFIETIHRRGYRLIAPVEVVLSDEPAAAKVARFPVSEKSFEDERSPYPGLSAFTENDAEFFFGREAEVTQLWRNLTARRLLAVIGPSGAGKSSLLRAGLIPAAPDGWATLICQPGEAPFAALAVTLAPEFRDEPETFSKFADIATGETAFSLLTRWRERYEEGVLIVDQFEELFTQNSLEVQARFTDLLGRLAREADVHVLLSMRDDFHFRCHEHEALSPVFDTITPISNPSRPDLQRALREPAARLGFAFENERLVEEMLDAVEGERVTLPLLAFTIARLWEARDPSSRLLTRQAYEDLGGIQGALAQHAEATLSSIGAQKLPIVREVFRNLVTAQGTRASREIDELMSVFEEPDSARKVVAALIDARLLTSYEVSTEDGETHRTVEIVHESLLANWPRLVRWQTQDADAAQLRDQLRQAARLWNDHDRSRDFLWTGKAFREFAVWRENYPGALSELEEDFAVSMTAHARRRKRRRRIAVAAGIAVLLAVLVVVTVSRQQALLEVRRAEAQKLLALGQAELEGYPTATLAYARASLELADTHEGRLVALRALWHGAAARTLELPGSEFTNVEMSSDGTRIAFSGNERNVVVYDHGGGPPTVFSDHALAVSTRTAAFGANGDVLVTGLYLDPDPEGFVVYDLRNGAKLCTVENPKSSFKVRGDVVYSVSFVPPTPPHRHSVVRACPIACPEPVVIGTLEGETRRWNVDSKGAWFAYRRGNTIRVRPLNAFDPSSERLIDPFDGQGFGWIRGTHGDWIATFRRRDNSIDIRRWPLEVETGGQRWSVPDPHTGSGAQFDGTGTRIAFGSTQKKSAYIVDLTGPPDADPLIFSRRDTKRFGQKRFSHDGQWLVTANLTTATFWWLEAPRPYVISGQTGRARELEFTPDSKWLASGGQQRRGAMLWPLTPEAGEARHVRWRSRDALCYGLAFDPSGERLLVAGGVGPVVVFPLDGREPMYLLESTWDDPETQAAMGDVAFDPTGRFAVAAANFSSNPEALLLRVWDLETGSLLASHPTWEGGERPTDYYGGIFDLRFSPDGTLYSAGAGGLHRWDLAKGTRMTMVEAEYSTMDLTSDGRFILFANGTGYDVLSSLQVLDLDSSDLRRITSHEDRITSIAIDPSGEFIVTGSVDGSVRIGPVTGAEPHLLLGTKKQVDRLAVSPDRRWIASAAGGETFIWPVPDMSRVPLHALSHEDLMAKLDSFTNLRVVRDEEAPTGWKLEVGPFTGWAEVPEW
jgi:DNA-binding winged helix-turn-helix (wHTH) protein/WD40 repeat protein